MLYKAWIYQAIFSSDYGEHAGTLGLYLAHVVFSDSLSHQLRTTITQATPSRTTVTGYLTP
eukprot:2824764-Rhodomonas_salina.1